MKAQIRRINPVGYLFATLLLVVAASTVRADTGAEQRVSSSVQGQSRERDSGSGSSSLDEYEALSTVGGRAASTRGSQQQADSAKSSQSGQQVQSSVANVDFWFYSATVDLYSDFDRDGYFSSIDLSFDVDTVYGVADVYAVIYLSRDFGPWNEYAVTDDFTIFGASDADGYFIDTDLVSGYATGDYDILIELFDTYDGAFVASIGPEDSSELSYLPLEDVGRDTPQGTTVVVNNGGGGSLSWYGLFALFGLALVLRLRESGS